MTTPPRVEVKTLDDLQPDPNNANKHTVRGHTLVENSLRKRGAFRSVAAAGKGVDKPVVMAGNLTIEKARDAGFSEVIFVHTNGRQLVSVIRDDIAPGSAEAIALGLEDNESASKSYSPDLDIVAALAAGDSAILSALKQEDKVFAGMLAGMGLKEETKDAPVDVDRAAELLEKWQTQAGQLWQLGNHRLLIADCTIAENVQRLADGALCGACVTDSPYGINREGIENDGPEGLRALFDGCLAVMPIENGVIINFQSPRLFPVWLDAVRAKGQKFERALWMYKENDVTFPWHGWLMTSEIIIISSLGNPEWGTPNEYRHDTMKIEWGKEVNGIHKTGKPLDIVVNLIENTSGDVYEPFAGSGTTIIAAENLSRRCFAMEISEKYAAVILQRFADAFPALAIRKME